MKIKICGLFREQDIDYVNEAYAEYGGPDYAGFVFALSKRQVTPQLAESLRSRLATSIIPVGVFVDAPVTEIAALYKTGTISIAQLHGKEDENYIKQLKDNCDIPIIKTIKFTTNHTNITNLNFDMLSPVRDGSCGSWLNYLLLDSGAGSGKTFNWDILKSINPEKPWFLAGGINLDNIEQAMSYKPYSIDVSGGAESDGYKDREKILQLVSIVRKRK